VTKDEGAARIAAVLDDEPGGATAIDRANGARGAAARTRGGGRPRRARDVAVGGETALAADTVDAVVADLWRIALVRARPPTCSCSRSSWRALVAPAYLLAASVLGYAGGLGLTVFVFQGVLGFRWPHLLRPARDRCPASPLGSDYNVFVAGRIWTGGPHAAPARGRRDRDAPRPPARSRWPGSTLAASFALLALVPVRAFREFALLMVVGVLIDTAARPLAAHPRPDLAGGRATGGRGRAGVTPRGGRRSSAAVGRRAQIGRADATAPRARRSPRWRSASRGGESRNV
jgi:RND superfamily putative drug exporter